jgi:hypothetical protein
VTRQARYTGMSIGMEVAYDVHWRIADPAAFAGVLSYDELRADSLPGPLEGTRRPGNVHALIIACVHRAAHHYDTDRVLLLYDIHLIASSLDALAWQRFVETAQRLRISAVCRRGLQLAATLFGEQCPIAAIDRLAAASREPSAAFVAGTMTRLDVLWSDLKTLPGWRERMALVYEHVFPAPDYLVQVRGAGEMRSGAIAFTYLSRLLRGVAAWRHPL